MSELTSKMHHGIPCKHGIEPMQKMQSRCKHKTGRFGRIFPHLPPLYNKPSELANLGGPKGPMNGGDHLDATQTVPLGFIFLGQFIDHDITLDITSSIDGTNSPTDIQNFRTPTLDLDCVYAVGPEASPYIYADDGVHILTGADDADVCDENDPRYHDLQRNVKDRALIGDFRNDENRIISQLQLAFIRFHNAVVDHLSSTTDLEGSGLFKEAQRLVRWHYQWIVVHEFLPLMIGEDLLQDILGNGRKFYKPTSHPFIPIEFSAAAYRFGHSMITQTVKTNPAGIAHNLFSAALGKGFAPVTDMGQVVDWRIFFGFDGLKPQFANKLNTKLAADLLDLPFINDGETSLATRNLLRGQSFLLPSGEQVAEEMCIDPADINTVRAQITSTIKNRAYLPAGTPLWYYILAEAEVLGRDGMPGEGLGPVGGRIVGEVLIGLLEHDSNSYLANQRNWSPTLLGDGTFGMADLLTFNQKVALPELEPA